MKNSRRDFVKKVGLGSAALAFGNSAFAMNANSYSKIQGANDRLRVAIVGTHVRGDQLAGEFVKLADNEIIYVCDVDENEMSKTISTVVKAGKPAPKGQKDFRIALEDKTLDAVVIATPDHWHAPATILACQAGKHVYCEKPLAHNPAEGELALQAARKYKRVVQMGAQRRSSPEDIEAIKELKNGVIGRVYFAKAWYTNSRRPIGFGKAAPVPSNLDYELWQGPAPRRPYKDNLIHYNWHWFWHWGTGEALNNGTHEMDLVRWGLGVDYPSLVSSNGGRYHFRNEDDWETPDTQIITWNFPGDKSAFWECRSSNRQQVENTTQAVMFYGDNGSMGLGTIGNAYTIYDQRGRVAKEVKWSVPGKTDQVTAGLAYLPHQSGGHVANFMDCIWNNKLPNADVEIGFKSTLLVQLGNIAYRTKRTLNIDPNNGHIINDSEAQKLWGREYQKGWEPKV